MVITIITISQKALTPFGSHNDIGCLYINPFVPVSLT